MDFFLWTTQLIDSLLLPCLTFKMGAEIFESASSSSIHRIYRIAPVQLCILGSHSSHCYLTRGFQKQMLSVKCLAIAAILAIPGWNPIWYISWNDRECLLDHNNKLITWNGGRFVVKTVPPWLTYFDFINR